MDLDGAGPAFDLLAGTRVVVEAPALHLQRPNASAAAAAGAEEAGEHRIDPPGVDAHVRARAHLALGIAGRGLDPEKQVAS